ncbi:MAG: protein kinase, partial [Planctomycetia bacterium]|nr:protein kinase [Planctomycetia bacterium]
MSNHTNLEDIIELFLDRFRAGDVPTVDEFIKQYPQHASDLAELIPLLLEMERASEKRMAKVIPVNTTMPEMPGSDYRLLKKIGQGGMGLVFEAIQMSLNRKVAVKLLASTLVADKRQREQFEREAQIVAMLHHPNIVKIFSVENRLEYCCYAMELIDGQGLNRYKIDDLRQLAG